MNLYKINITKYIQLKWKINSKDSYIQSISKICIPLLYSLQNSSKRFDIDLRTKLNIIENYININIYKNKNTNINIYNNSIYNIYNSNNINIYTILKIIFENLKFDTKTDYIYLSEDTTLNEVKLSVLAKIIMYGTNETPKVNIIQEYIDLAVKTLNGLVLI